MTKSWKYLSYPVSFFGLAFLLAGCFESDYTKLVKSELAKGVRMDSTVFGINFGDTKQEYFGKCFDLNQQRLVTAGPNGSSVQFLFSDSLIHDQPTPMRLLFVPSFDQNEVIMEMNLEFTYTGWSPWNEQYQSDKLKDKVLQLIMYWYKGNEFMTVKIGDDMVPVKLDGNRRFLVYIKDEQTVIVKIQDILHPQFRHSITPETEKKN